MQIIINSVNDLDYPDSNTTFLKVEMLKTEAGPELKITANYAYGEADEIYSLVKSVCSDEARNEFNAIFFEAIEQKNPDASIEFLEHCISQIQTRDRQITWTNIDSKELLEDHFDMLEEAMNEGEEDEEEEESVKVKLIRPKINEEDLDEQWLADTNFDTSYEEIMSIEGVDSCTFISRYKFVISIGKMFTFKEVRRSMIQKLGLKS